MRCIFCKASTANSKSCEHIIPESLGNAEHVLPAGWVCDACNNYLSRKVEAPFLNSWYGRNSRFEMRVPSKRGRVPPATGVHLESRSRIEVHINGDGSLAISAAPGEDESRFIRSISSHSRGTLCAPATFSPPQDYVTARFIAKVALEIFADKCMGIGSWNDTVVDMKAIDELRYYVRRGKPGFIWPIHVRRIYPADWVFSDGKSPAYQVLHEWGILPIGKSPGACAAEYYVVLAMFGIEYVVNLGGPELGGFEEWLKENHGMSYLYAKRPGLLPRHRPQ